MRVAPLTTSGSPPLRRSGIMFHGWALKSPIKETVHATLFFWLHTTNRFGCPGDIDSQHYVLHDGTSLRSLGFLRLGRQSAAHDFHQSPRRAHCLGNRHRPSRSSRSPSGRVAPIVAFTNWTHRWAIFSWYL